MWILSTTFFLLFLQSEMDITKRVQLSSFITKVVPTLGHYFSPLDSKVQYLCTFDFSCFGWARENFRRNNWRLRQVSFVQLSQQLQWNCQLQILCKWIQFKTVPPVMLFWLTNQLTTLLLKVEQASKCDWSTLIPHCAMQRKKASFIAGLFHTVK